MAVWLFGVTGSVLIWGIWRWWPRRFPPPWSVDPDTKLGQDCCIVRDADGHALVYVYFAFE